MKLRLKDEYKGVIVSRNDIKIGRITFDSNKVSEENYKNFYKLGFEYLFELIIEEVIEEIKEFVEDKIETVKNKRKTNAGKKL